MGEVLKILITSALKEKDEVMKMMKWKKNWFLIYIYIDLIKFSGKFEMFLKLPNIASIKLLQEKWKWQFFYLIHKKQNKKIKNKTLTNSRLIWILPIKSTLFIW